MSCPTPDLPNPEPRTPDPTIHMSRFLPKSLNQWLLAAIPLTLLLGWLTGHWLLGAAASLGALCLLASRATPEQVAAATSRWKSLLRRGEKSSDADPTSTTTVTPTPAAPPRRRYEKDKSA